MKHFFLYIIAAVGFINIDFHALLCMETNLDRATSERLTQMEKTLSDNTRIGHLATLIIAKRIQESYYPTILKEVETHPDIITKQKVTEKSYSCKYTYNPFVLEGLCPNDTSPLALAFLKMLKNEHKFNPETQRNNLNDYFFDKYDKPNNFQQVDFCVSAKHDPTTNIYQYVARFFNKEALLNTIVLFNPESTKNS